jgi:hypothetical protein
LAVGENNDNHVENVAGAEHLTSLKWVENAPSFVRNNIKGIAQGYAQPKSKCLSLCNYPAEEYTFTNKKTLSQHICMQN